MINLVVKQSVALKCKIAKSGLLGNYEYYYAAGLFAGLSGSEIATGLPPRELRDALLSALPSWQPSDNKELWLKTMLEAYHPSDEKDEEMDAFFEEGKQEKATFSL